MNMRTLLIAGAAAVLGLSAAGTVLASPDRAEPREVVSHDRATAEARDRNTNDSADKADKADKADANSADKSGDSQDTQSDNGSTDSPG